MKSYVDEIIIIGIILGCILSCGNPDLMDAIVSNMMSKTKCEQVK